MPAKSSLWPPIGFPRAIPRVIIAQITKKQVVTNTFLAFLHSRISALLFLRRFLPSPEYAQAQNDTPPSQIYRP